MMMRLGLMIFLLLAASGGVACAHEVRPAYLEITETSAHGYTILWKQPVMGEMAVHLVPHLSSGWLDRDPVTISATPRYLIKTWIVSSPAAALDGQTLEVEGLDRTITDALVSIKPVYGNPLQEQIDAHQPKLTIHLNGQGQPLPAYLKLGITHILTGPDHLMFVLGLLLLVGSPWQMAKTVTAFTVAHSMTLAASALGLIHLYPPMVEALVALSIVFVAVELVHSYQGHGGLTLRLPWLIAFSFGLLHGAAFASALAEVGLPQGEVAISLFLFNLGVEIGQLAFIAAVLPLVWLARRLPDYIARWGKWVPPYAIGACASAWFIERMATAFA